MRRLVDGWTCVPLAILACLSAGWPAWAADEPAAADKAIFAKIEKLRAAAAKLHCDGSDRDWAEFPELKDPRGDAGGDSARDIVGIAIAPTETDLWILLRTAGQPTTDPYAYYFALDLLGEQGPHLRIEIKTSDGPPVARQVDIRGNLIGDDMLLTAAQVAIRRQVELRLPYAELARALPPEQAKLLGVPSARPWVRVQPQTWHGQKQKTVDRGPSIASYRLQPTPYALDAPLPHRPSAPVEVDLPLKGQWFVLQGPYSAHSHRNLWAYDFTKTDAEGNVCQPLMSKRP